MPMYERCWFSVLTIDETWRQTMGY